MPADNGFKPLTREQMACRVARDIPPGSYVNIGIGLPEKVTAYVRDEDEVVFQSENGMLGMGPLASPEHADRELVNAGKKPVTLRVGGSFFHHGDSFAMMRGGHLDIAVLGGYQVAANADLANWSRGIPGVAPGVGGAMDLAVGAKRLFVIMEHTTKDGEPRLLERCTLPLTGLGVVTRVFTDLAVVDCTPEGFCVQAMVAGLTPEQLQQRTGARLAFAPRIEVLA
jgi:3-oxoadipate CoA-transferase, beta subunit